jgi:hypothetical protein
MSHTTHFHFVCLRESRSIVLVVRGCVPQALTGHCTPTSMSQIARCHAYGRFVCCNNCIFRHFRGFSHHNSIGGLGVAIPERVQLFRVQASRAMGASSHSPSDIGHGVRPLRSPAHHVTRTSHHLHATLLHWHVTPLARIPHWPDCLPLYDPQ